MAQPNLAIPSHTTEVSQRQQGRTSGNPTPDTPGYSQSYNGHSGRATGWIQLCCAVSMILVGVAQFLLGSYIRFFSIGIWTGFVCYGPAGILGIVSFRKRTSVISAYIAMSVISAIFAFFMMLFGAFSAGIYAQNPCYAQTREIPCEEGLREGRTASDAIMAIVGLIEMIVAIVGSAYGCGGVHQYPVVSLTNQQGMATPLQEPPPYTPQQQQQIYPPQQTIPQQSNAPQQTIPQQTSAPQQTFQQQQTIAHPQTSTQQPNNNAQQHYTELQTYQPLLYPNNQGRQNSGLTVNLPQR